MFRKRKLSAPTLPTVLAEEYKPKKDPQLYSLLTPPLSIGDKSRFLTYIASAFLRCLLLTAISVCLIILHTNKTRNQPALPLAAAYSAIGVLFVGICGETAILLNCTRRNNGVLSANYCTISRIHVFLSRFSQMVNHYSHNDSVYVVRNCRHYCFGRATGLCGL